MLIASIQFYLVVKDLNPRNIILPMIVASIVGFLLGYNAILRKRLERSNNTKSQFLARMNHELRTPISAIIGFSDIMTDDDNLEPNQKDLLRRIHGAGDYLLNLINELLEFASVETGKTKIVKENMSPVATVLEAVSIVSPLAQENNIQINHKYTGFDQLYIVTDDLRLKQIMINLLSNAVKYNRANGSVTISYTLLSDALQISVEDTGNGIPPEKKSELFEPFNRLGAEDTHVKGTGIGLSVTKALIEMMDGHIQCDSIYGQGTIFTIQLPLETAAESALANPSSG
jgi:signal transduction histidine kinase